MAIFLAVLTTILVAWMSYRYIFDSVDELLECVQFWLTPDIISYFRGEYDMDWWAELKLFFWLIISGLMGFGIYLKFN